MSRVKHGGPLSPQSKHGIPVPTIEPSSLRRTVEALRLAVEELSRQRGDMLNSAVCVKDLLNLNLVSVEDIKTLDPGGAYYSLRGTPQPPAEDS